MAKEFNSYGQDGHNTSKHSRPSLATKISKPSTQSLSCRHKYLDQQLTSSWQLNPRQIRIS